MAKPSNSIKSNISLHNTKVTLSIASTILEALQNYLGYIVKVEKIV